MKRQMNSTDCSLALQANGWNGLIALQMHADNLVRLVVVAVDDFIKCYMTGKKIYDALKTWFVVGGWMDGMDFYVVSYFPPYMVNLISTVMEKLHLFVFSTNNLCPSCQTKQFSLTPLEFCHSHKRFWKCALCDVIKSSDASPRVNGNTSDPVPHTTFFLFPLKHLDA